MNVFRKLIGLFIIVFFAFPILFGVIWTVGMTKAVVSPEFLSELPQNIISEVPGMMDDIIDAVEKDDSMLEGNQKVWFKAMAESRTSFKELLKESGILNWLENELSGTFNKIGQMLRGEQEFESIVLDLKPLKQALKSEAFENYMLGLLEKLPPCDKDKVWEWKSFHKGDDLFDYLPACKPDMKLAKATFKGIQSFWVEDIPDEVDMVETQGISHFPEGLNIAKLVVSLTYLLFLIPLVLLALGAIFGGTSAPGFFQWFGLSTLVGGLLPLGLALLAKNMVPLGIKSAYYSGEFTDQSLEISTELQEVLVDKVGGLIHMVSDQLFSPVITVAGTVCVIGLILFALSFTFSPKEEKPVLPYQNPKPIQKETETETPDNQ